MKTKVIKIKDKTRPEDGELLEAAEATVCRPDQGAVAHVVELIERTISN